MKDIFEQIKEIPIADILFKLGIKYKQIGNTLNLYDGDKLTDGWKGNVNNNFITDFTGKRGQGDGIAFIESQLGLTKHEAIEWFKNNFNIMDTKKDFVKTKPQTQNNYNKIDVKSKFNSLQNLNDKQIDYLKLRGINYNNVCNVVKNNNGIGCMLYNEKGQPISMNTRSIEDKRFYILPGTQSKGVYMGKINRDIKKVYVVEGMFDFLSLYQFGVNVIGLKSAKDGIDVVREFYNKGYELIIIPDNDEPGKEILNQLQDIKYSWFDLSKYEVKDTNDFLLESGFGEGIIEVIEEEKQKGGYQEEFEIVNYSDTLQDGLNELEATDPNNAIHWGFEELDNKIGYIFPGQLILVGGTTGTGKSTFTGEIAKNISRVGNKVLKFTLEDRLEDNKKRDLFNEINKIRRKTIGFNGENLKPYPYNEFMSNDIKSDTLQQEKTKAIQNLKLDNKNIYEIKRYNEKQIDIQNLEMIIKKGVDMGCNLIVLDHLQEFKVEGDKDRQDLKIEEMMYKIKNLTRKYKIAIILIAHFKKVNGVPDENSFKDSIAITQVANKVLILHRDKLEANGLTDLYIYKNREKPNGTGKLELNFDFDNLKYTNSKSKTQIKKENLFHNN